MRNVQYLKHVCVIINHFKIHCSSFKKQPVLDLVHVFLCVLVGHVGGADVQLEVRPEVLKVVIVRQLCNRNIIEKSEQTV